MMVKETPAEFGHGDRLKRPWRVMYTAGKLGIPLGRKTCGVVLVRTDALADLAGALAVIQIPGTVMEEIGDAAHAVADSALAPTRHV
jgi:hypothetical protein